MIAIEGHGGLRKANVTPPTVGAKTPSPVFLISMDSGL